MNRCLCFLLVAGLGAVARGADDSAAPLPPGVRAVWDTGKAFCEATVSRERICLNGLWQWQPAEANSAVAPVGNWGWFKVPGCWPGITDYMQKDCQTVFAHPNWKEQKIGDISAAWYQRQVAIPSNWNGRRIAIRAEYLNSFAAVYVDGKPAGEIHFPGGELDLSAACRPGATHRLSLLVVAMPLKGVMLSYSDSASAREVKGSVARRGLCGDVYLVGTPRGPRVGDVTTAQNTFTVEVSLHNTAGKLLDVGWSERCGFREFRIEGRDFYLNGTRLFLSAVPLDNAQISAGLATYEAARESLERLQSFGINLVYTHN